MFNVFFRKPARVLVVLFILLLSSLPIQTFAISKNEPPQPAAEPPSVLTDQVMDWMSALSKREPFVSWKNAFADIQTLGPGTHSWLVLISSKRKVVGYMIVQAAADGSFRLGEYGTGPATLFSDAVLKRTLTDNGLLSSQTNPSIAVRKHYFHPFAAFWEVTIDSDTYWLDAKTGELLPMNAELLKGQTKKTPIPVSTSGQGVSSVWLKSTFDPYERLPWLIGEKPFTARDAATVQSRIRSKLHLRYVTEPFGEAILYALPVTGFQRWTGGRLDVALDMAGSRFIPLDTLISLGRFYR